MSARYYTSQFTEELWDSQGGICAWCHKPIERLGKGLASVDHNHRCCSDKSPVGRTLTCGRCIRGLVHHKCNITDIRAADWALEHGLSFPDTAMLEYLLRGEPDGTSGVKAPRYEPALRVDESPIPAGDIYSWPEYPSPEEVFLGAENLQELRSVCPTMCAKYLDGFSYWEIARNQGVSTRAIDRRVSKEKERARKQWRLAA